MFAAAHPARRREIASFVKSSNEVHDSLLSMQGWAHPRIVLGQVDLSDTSWLRQDISFRPFISACLSVDILRADCLLACTGNDVLWDRSMQQGSNHSSRTISPDKPRHPSKGRAVDEQSSRRQVQANPSLSRLPTDSS